MASVAFWYQEEPHSPFPGLPLKDRLLIRSGSPVNHLAVGKSIDLKTEPSPKYNHEPACLVDGITGGLHFADNCWMGFEGNDMEAIIDLGRPTQIHQIRVSYLMDQDSWIFLPARVEYLVSLDGKNYKTVATFKESLARDISPSIKTYSKTLRKITARFIRVKAMNIGTCPRWHPGAGSKSWIFTDEICVE